MAKEEEEEAVGGLSRDGHGGDADRRCGCQGVADGAVRGANRVFTSMDGLLCDVPVFAGLARARTHARERKRAGTRAYAYGAWRGHGAAPASVLVATRRALVFQSSRVAPQARERSERSFPIRHTR